MWVKHFGIIAVLTLLCFCWGCGNGGEGTRVSKLLSRQEEHGSDIKQMSTKIDAVDERLAGIERKVNALLAGGTVGEGGRLMVSSDFAETKEYKDIMRQIAALQEQVGTVGQGFASFTEEENQRKELAALRDRGTAWRALGQPKELNRRLDILTKNFSGSIADAATRDQFISDVEALKSSYGVELTPEQKRDQARAMLTQRLTESTDDRATRFLEEQLKSLDDANAQQVNERVDRMYQFQTVREIADLSQKYNIPEDVMTDSGLVSLGGRGGPGGFPGFGGPGMGRRGGGPGGGGPGGQ